MLFREGSTTLGIIARKQQTPSVDKVQSFRILLQETHVVTIELYQVTQAVLKEKTTEYEM